MKKYLLLLISLFLLFLCEAQKPDKYILLKPEKVFDGEQMQTGWVVLVKTISLKQPAQ